LFDRSLVWATNMLHDEIEDAWKNWEASIETARDRPPAATREKRLSQVHTRQSFDEGSVK